MSASAFRDFKERQEELSSMLKDVAQRLKSSHYESSAKQLNELAHELSSFKFKIAIIGEFSTGKSTLLNAFLGDYILPAKMAPCTLSLVEVHYGPKRLIKVIHKGSGHVELLPFSSDALNDYVTIKAHDNDDALQEIDENPIEKVIVEVPLDLCEHGVILIDTPGLNEHQVRSDITQGVLAKLDAALILTKATQLLTKSEKEALEAERAKPEHLRRWMEHAFIAATFADVAFDDEDSEPELRARLDKFCEQLELAPQRRYFVDARSILHQAIGKKITTKGVDFLRLYQDLSLFVTNNRGRASLQNAAISAKGLLNESLAQVHAELKQIESDVELARVQIEQMRLDLEAQRQRAAQISQAFRDQAPELTSRITPLFEAFTSSMLYSGLAEYLNTCTYSDTIIRKKPAIEWFQHKANEWMDEQIQAWANECPPTEFKRQISMFEQLYQEDLNAFRSSLESVASGLGITVGTGSEEESGLGWIFASGAGWLAGGPLGAVVGGVLGWEGVVANLALNFGIGFLAGAVGLAIPVIGWIVLAAVIAATQLFVGQDGIQAKLRTEVVKAFQKEMPPHFIQAKSALNGHIESSLFEIADGIEMASFGLINNLEEEVQRREQLDQMQEYEKEARRETLIKLGDNIHKELIKIDEVMRSLEVPFQPTALLSNEHVTDSRHVQTQREAKNLASVRGGGAHNSPDALDVYQPSLFKRIWLRLLSLFTS